MKADAATNSELKRLIARRIARGTTFIGIEKFTSILFGFLTVIIVTRFLSPGEYGSLVLALITSEIALIGADFGLGSALVKYASEKVALKNSKAVSEIFTTSLKIKLLFGGIASISVFVLSDGIATLVFRDPAVSLFIRIAAFVVFTNNLMGLVTASFQGLQKFELITLFGTLFSFLRLVFVSLFLLAGLKVSGVLLGYVLGGISIAIIGVMYISMKMLNLRLRLPSLRLPYSRELLIFGAYPTIDRILGIFYSQLNLILLATYHLASDVGLFNIASTTVACLCIAPGIMEAALYPIMSERCAMDSQKELRDLLDLSTKLLVVATFPITLLIMAAPSQIILLLYTSEYLPAYQALMILALLSIVTVSTTALGSMVYAKGRPDIRTKASVITAVVNTSLCLLLIPKWSIVGAATSLVAAFIAGWSVVYVWFSKATGLTISTETITKPLIASTLIGLIVFVLSKFWPVSILIYALIGFLIYILLLRAMGVITKSDLPVIEGMFGKKIAGIVKPLIGK